MKRQNVLAVAGLILLIITITGCGGARLPQGQSIVASQPVTTQPGAAKVTLTVSPGIVWLGATQTQQFTATVTGISDSSVTWNVSCAPGDDCGTINASGLYTAPSTITRRTTLWIQANPKVTANQSNAARVYLMPIAVAVSPSTPVNVLPGGTRDFAAAVQYDPHSSGVTWALSGTGCSGDSCGLLTNLTGTSVVYTAPAASVSGTVMLTAASVTDNHITASVLFTISDTPAMLLGKYAFLINGWRRESDVDTIEAIAGHFDADGNGNISGTWDANRGAPVAKGEPVTGSYNLQPDGGGTLQIRAADSTWTYLIALNEDGRTARLVESTPPSGGGGNRRGSSGYLVKQDASAFATSSTQGDRVIALFGEADCCHLAALGRFAVNSQGALSNTAMDLSWVLHDSDLALPNSVALAGSFGLPDSSTGRGVVPLTLTPSSGPPATYSFAYYIVSPDTMLLVQTDKPGRDSGLLVPTLSGEIQKQNGMGRFSDLSLNVPVGFYLSNSSPFMWCGPFPAATIGEMIPTGSGLVTTTFDQNEGGDVLLNETVNGTYSASSNGRVVLNTGIYTNFAGAKIWVHTGLAYLVDQNHGYLMQAGMRGGAIGAFEPRTGMPFSAASVAGTYLFYTDAPTTVDAHNDVGWLTLTEDGSVTGTVYVNNGTGVSPHAVTGTFSVASDGHGTLLLESPSRPEYVGWGSYVLRMSSPTRGVALIPGGKMSELFHIQRVENK